MTIEYLPVKLAIERVIGKEIHQVTAYRWTTNRNRYGAVLESWLIAGRRMTTESAVRRYLDASKTGEVASRA